jgi:hypothetical protein
MKYMSYDLIKKITTIDIRTLKTERISFLYYLCILSLWNIHLQISFNIFHQTPSVIISIIINLCSI